MSIMQCSFSGNFLLVATLPAYSSTRLCPLLHVHLMAGRGSVGYVCQHCLPKTKRMTVPSDELPSEFVANAHKHKRCVPQSKRVNNIFSFSAHKLKRNDTSCIQFKLYIRHISAISIPAEAKVENKVFSMLLGLLF